LGAQLENKEWAVCNSCSISLRSIAVILAYKRLKRSDGFHQQIGELCSHQAGHHRQEAVQRRAEILVRIVDKEVEGTAQVVSDLVDDVRSPLGQQLTGITSDR